MTNKPKPVCNSPRRNNYAPEYGKPNDLSLKFVPVPGGVSIRLIWNANTGWGNAPAKITESTKTQNVSISSWCESTFHFELRKQS